VILLSYGGKGQGELTGIQRDGLIPATTVSRGWTNAASRHGECGRGKKSSWSLRMSAVLRPSSWS